MLCIAAACGPAPHPAADLIVTNAAVWTGDAARPEAEAIAVVGDRIVEVGRVAEIDRWRSAATQVIDAGRRRLIPGFNDAHVHFASGGTQLVSVDLRDAASAEEFARRIIERARSRPGEWIVGGQWDERRWSPPRLPGRDLIDDGTNGTPVLVTRFDGHTALANAAALGRAGITEQTADPLGGAIARDPRGFPTGLLQGTAVDVVTRVVPKPTRDQRRQTIARALEHALSFGVTSVQDMNPDPTDVSIYAELAERGDLTVRIYAIPNETTWFEQARLGLRRDFGGPALRLGAVAGDAVSVGVDQLLTRLMAADHAALQLCVNADADGAGSALDMLASIVRANGESDRRARIEHAERARAADVDRLVALHAIASIQPAAAGEPAILRQLAARGVALAMATDWPAAPLNPLSEIAAAARQMPVREALAAYTRGSAFAEFQDAAKGILARGALADFVILSGDVLAAPPDRVANISVVTTVAAGKVVHQRRP